MEYIYEILRLQNAFPGLKIGLIGSHFVCDPPVTDTDIDILIYASMSSAKTTTFRRITSTGPYHALCVYLSSICEGGFGPYIQPSPYTDHKGRDGPSFKSFRKGNINFIVTYDEICFENMKKAAGVSKLLNLTNKEDRIKVAQYLVYGD